MIIVTHFGLQVNDIMKRQLFTFALLFAGTYLQAQKLHLTTFAGVSNYQGDLQDKKFTFQQAHLGLGIGAAYELTDQLYVTAGFKAGKLSGDDKRSVKNAARNLNFSSPLTEFETGLEYDLLNLNEHRLTPYFFAGVAVFHFNPSTLDSNGNKVFLQPLGTEGQGFYNGRTRYKLTQISIPFGGGVKFALSDDIRVGVEIGLRKLFTDYIDDVSTTYVDKTLLLLNNGPQAVSLAFRGNELKTGNVYPPDGTVRGNPKSKDWYYFSGVTLSFRLGANGMQGGYSGRNKTGCPVSVY